jgi:hypothetical protein
MPGFRHTGAMSKGCSDVDVRQSAEASVSHTIRIVEVGFDPVAARSSRIIQFLPNIITENTKIP